MMLGRWFNAAVISLWLATMGWLLKEKVLPPMLVGDPPSYSTIVEARKNAPPVGWRLSFNGRSLGWALSDTQLQPTGLTDIHGRVHFDSLPLDDMMPGWLRSLSRLVRMNPVNQLQLDARSVLTIDSLGHLLHFDSVARVDPFDEIVCVRGIVEGQQLQLTVRSGEATFTNEKFLPADALLCDALSPQSQLPGLRIGQTWTVPVYSPLWPAKSPMEVVQATVEKSEPLSWGGKMEDCLLVVYRNDSGSGAGDSQAVRGKLWVRHDGMVLKQQIVFFDALVSFDRLCDNEAMTLADVAGGNWWSVEEEDVRRGSPAYGSLQRSRTPFVVPTARRDRLMRNKPHD